VLGVLWSNTAQAQGTTADYERSNNLYWSTFGSVYHGRVFPHWTADGNAFWYMSIDPKMKRHYWWVDAVAGTRKPAFDHVRLASALRTGLIIMNADPDHLTVSDIATDAKGNLVLEMFGLRTVIDPKTYTMTNEIAVPAHVLPRMDAVIPPTYADDGDDPAIICRVVNHTNGPINIEGVLPDGSQQECEHGVVGQTSDEIGTCTGAVFVATDASKNFLGAYRVDGDGGTIVIAPPVQPATSPVTMPSTAQAPSEPGASPDGRWIAFCKDHNVRLRDRRNGKEMPISTDGREGDGYNDAAGCGWSPGSESFLVIRTADGGDRLSHWVQSSPTDQLQPKLESLSYPLPSDQRISCQPHLFSTTGKEIPIVGLHAKDAESMWSQTWNSDPPTFGLYYIQRGHQVAQVLTINATNGQAKLVVNETSKTFLDTRVPFWRANPATHELVWLSERDGWNHFYRYDTQKAQLSNQVGKGEWAVEPWDDKWDQVDWKDNWVFFRARGIDPSQDPYYLHYCRATLDGNEFYDLTPGDGMHEVQDSPDGRFYIDTCSRVDMPPVTVLRRYSDQSVVCPLEKGDAGELLATGWRYPERFDAKGRDGVTDIYGVIYRPTNFDPNKKYPVIEDIYTGPQQSSVPKAFTRWNYPMRVAELGFIVVQIDGMGTPGRGKAFHNACWHNLRDCGFADRIAWIKAAAASHPFMDLSRVGLYGGSSGGYAAVRALEDHGDFYKVAVSQDGPHDARLTYSGASEQWMGWPIGPWYAEQANTDPAAVAKINGKLLLIVSELDHTVHPSNTMQLVNALIKANKDFDFLEIPNSEHCDNSQYTYRRREDFLVRNLLGVEPREK
jgi:dipeptidyl-peptidase-4